MRKHRTLAVVLATGAMLATSALPASANHTHVRLLGNGNCVVLAPEGGEIDVQLPHADGFTANRRHPLHVNVHLGPAGMRGGDDVVWVRYSDGATTNCVGYVNQRG
jgi:hypothetical protein